MRDPSIKYASTVIPPITNPLGKGWVQPHLDMIQLDDKNAYMREGTFNSIADYTDSRPTGVYEGKVWKTRSFIDDRTTRDWVLHWFGLSDDPNKCSNHWREIVIMYSEDDPVEKIFKRIK